ncbi:MAG: LysR family transcriptional regulator [Gammaproteobacteria bacterium]|nr:LysR family transcriptional regulator [Gammaproteobacteria bacterium]
MKIQHLRFLTAVVDYGGVNKAATRLHLSQPAISAGLKALESELGRSLFDRSTPANRPLRLTPAGRRFYRSALDILKQCDAARADIVGLPDEPRRLRFGVIDTLAQSTIVSLLRRFGKQQPDIVLELWEGSAERVAGWLAQRRVDIACTNVNDLTPNTQVLWREPLVAVVAPRHPFAKVRGRVIAIRDFDRQSFVHRSRCELDLVGRAQLRAAGVTLRVSVRAEREQLAFQLIRSGKHFTLAPKSLVPDDLVAVTVSDLTVARTIGIQWHEKLDPTLVAVVSDTLTADCT